MYGYLFSGASYATADLVGTKVMMREEACRHAFCTFLEDPINHPHFELNSSSFSAFCDVVHTVIDESFKANDFMSLQRIYKVSSLFGTNMLPVNISCKSSFIGAFSWARHDEFWTNCATALVKKDLDLWSKICFICKENRIDKGDLFGVMTNTEIRALLVCMRIQAIIPSLRSVGFENEYIHTLLQQISGKLGLRESGINLKLTPSKEFLLRILVMSTSVFLPCIVEQQQCLGDIDSNADTGSRERLTSIYSDMSVREGRLTFAEYRPSVPCRYGIGYCPAVELVLQMHVHLLRVHQEGGRAAVAAVLEDRAQETELLERLDDLMAEQSSSATPLVSGGSGLDSSTTGRRDGRRGVQGKCVCGCPITPWRFLDLRTMNMHPHLRHVLNVLSYQEQEQRAKSNHTRDQGHTGQVGVDGASAAAMLASVVTGTPGSVATASSKDSPYSSSAQHEAAVMALQAKKFSLLVPQLLCESCYRLLLASPLTVESQHIQCTGLCPPALAQPMSDEQVSFADIFHLAYHQREFVDYGQIEFRTPPTDSRTEANAAVGAGTGMSSDRDINFGVFERLLTAAIKSHSAPGGGGKDLSHRRGSSSRQGTSSATTTAATATATTDAVSGSASRAPVVESGLVHGIQGIRARNSRDMRYVLGAGSKENDGTRSRDQPTRAVERGAQAPRLGQEHKEEHKQGQSALSGDQRVAVGKLESQGSFLTDVPMQSTTKLPSSTSTESANGRSTAPAAPAMYSPATSNNKRRDLVNFLVRIWDGISLKIVFSQPGKPSAEKQRTIYLRAATARFNSYIQQHVDSYRGRLASAGAAASGAEDAAKAQSSLLDAVATLSLYVCWARPNIDLEFNADKALDVDTVKHIKVGSGRWEQCINLGSATKTLVLKAEDPLLFKELLAGFTGLIASRNLS